MRFVIFGLTLSSSWGNGHATLWRGLLKALARRGHTILFYEKDVPYYAETRDDWVLPARVELKLFSSLADIRMQVQRELDTADVAMMTSYCGDAAVAAELILSSGATVKAFYDLDTPITLNALTSGEDVPYLPKDGLSDFDLVLSYTGGSAVDELESELGAKRVKPLYGWVDPELHAPAHALPEFRSDLSYLGTYAADRQTVLEELFVKAARVLSEARFAIGGAQYPQDFPWSDNIFFVRHLPPSLHPAFFCSGRATLNVTRLAMAKYGYCPSGRLFEAAACGTALISDVWQGLDSFFRFGEEILPVRTTDDVIAALALSDAELNHIAQAARERTLADHTASARALELERILDEGHASQADSTEAQPAILA